MNNCTLMCLQIVYRSFRVTAWLKVASVGQGRGLHAAPLTLPKGDDNDCGASYLHASDGGRRGPRGCRSAAP
jgi:hypothetical protein